MNASKVGSILKVVGVALWVLGAAVGFVGCIAFTKVYGSPITTLTFLVFLIPGATLWRLGRWLERRGRSPDDQGTPNHPS